MKKFKSLKLIVMMAAFVFLLTACSKGDKVTENSEVASEEVTTVEIEDLHGKVTVPVNPKKVVALDSRTFNLLSDWDIKLEAVPKDVMPVDSPYVLDDSVQNIGNHREPNLELVASIEPDLVIIGQRFAKYYEEVKEIVPNATVIDLNFDVSKEVEHPGENLVKGLKHSTTVLGQIFDKNKEAEELLAEFDKSIEDVKKAYNGTDTVMSVVVSGGNIGFSAPMNGRVWGPMYEIFDWVPSLEVKESSSDHQGDDISVEAIAQSNPDWILVLDRDAAISSNEDSVPARDVIDNSPALKNTKAIKEGNIVYAPNETYTNESIQTYLKLFKDLSKALSK